VTRRRVLAGALAALWAAVACGRAAPVLPAGSSDAGFTVLWNRERSRLPVNPLLAAAGQTVGLSVDDDRVAVFSLDAGAGTVRRLGARAWRWTAPRKPGAYTLEIRRSDGASVRFTALVTIPRQAVRRGVLNGYLIGNYPTHPRGDALYRPPEGFIEVDSRTAELPLTPHLTLGQFVCKQDAGGRRYVALRERLPLALEAALERFARAGIASGGLTVMSGYRTPHYNRQLGDTRFSRHQFGDAADIFIDQDGDGRMDDLNGDGRQDVEDARLLLSIIEAAQGDVDWQRFSGGLSAYPPTAWHGGFVHLDTRGPKARW
jgi:hypothetical protein